MLESGLRLRLRRTEFFSSQFGSVSRSFRALARRRSSSVPAPTPAPRPRFRAPPIPIETLYIGYPGRSMLFARTTTPNTPTMMQQPQENLLLQQQQQPQQQHQLTPSFQLQQSFCMC
ncbi:Hypothetical predicted protein [Drosophila guanche]|uniref:Uncharacterized protein n=1 Tax=Drosophila guanche TaxID=7266 RepID=A0A3B0K845_DROGU|nr:Hypothetical predicted protein [Drosophila guanche]